jgi:hypothetical protein
MLQDFHFKRVIIIIYLPNFVDYDDDYCYFDKELCNAGCLIVALSEDMILSK